MNFRTVTDMVVSRCQDLGLKGADSGQVDVSAIELQLLQVLQELADSWDLDGLTVQVEPMFSTQTGQRTYRLPEDFGRFLTPQDVNTSGLLLSDGTREWPLHYKEPREFRRQWTTTNGRPNWYTLLADRQVQLDPPPDANSDSHYTGIGQYVQAITPALLDGEVPLSHPLSLVDMTVARLVVDKTHPNQQFILAQGEQARSRLVNHQARMRQQFQSQSGRTWRQTRRR